MSQSFMNQMNGVLPSNLDQQSTLRGVFAVHFGLITLVLFGNWVPLAYVWYNGFMMAGLLWAMMAISTDNGNAELPLTKSLFIDVIAIPIDILVMIAAFDVNRTSGGGWNGVSLAACIVNLVARVLSILLLYRARNEHQTRQYSTNPSWAPSAGRQPAAGYADPNNEYSYDVPQTHGRDTKPLTP